REKGLLLLQNQLEEAADRVRAKLSAEDQPGKELRDASREIETGESLLEFVREAWPILKPGRKFVEGWYIGAICEHLQALWDDEIDNLVINLPFRLAKSTIANVCFPAFGWTRRPWWQWLCISYAEKLALRDNVDMRRLITSQWYREKYQAFRLTDDQNQK